MWVAATINIAKNGETRAKHMFFTRHFAGYFVKGKFKRIAA